MFFKKIFNKDYRYYLERGEKFFSDERYADARHEFQESIRKLPAGSEDSSDAMQIRSRLVETGNRLALLNLAEAEHAASREEFGKATEHLDLADELATEAAIRERMEVLRGTLFRQSPAMEPEEMSHGCSGCAKDGKTVSTNEPIPDFLSAQERFELLVQTLPVGLQERYAALGKKFVEGYLMVHGADEAAGLKILQELLDDGEDDILLYEIALAHFRAGNKAECERLLRRAFDLNNGNPLCCMGLVQLLADAGRLDESLPILNHMVAQQLLTEQSLLFLGDVHHGLGDDSAAFESYSKALTYPTAARAAAERLIPLLEKGGRREDAAYLFQRYLKGCC